MITGIILLAGNSTRYGKNKNLELLNGKYVFLYSLDAFQKNSKISDIILVVRQKDRDIINKIVLSQNYSKNIKIVIGGATRSESVYNALINTNSKIVVIHDAARPLIKDKYINNIIEALNKYDGAITGVLVKDTIKIVNDAGEIIESTKRINTYLGQTPQAFDRELLLNLHIKYQNDLNITDDSMLLERENYKVKITEGDYTNIKITTPGDIIIAKEYLTK